MVTSTIYLLKKMFKCGKTLIMDKKEFKMIQTEANRNFNVLY